MEYYTHSFAGISQEHSLLQAIKNNNQQQIGLGGLTSMWNLLFELGPGRPSAGGPRMDRQVVTSLVVEKFSRLASRLQRSAWTKSSDPKS